MNYFILENGASSDFSNIKRKTIDKWYSMFFRPSSIILRSAVGVTNLLVTKNLVADLLENLSKDILSFWERFSKGSVKFPLRILIHFWGTAWHKP